VLVAVAEVVLAELAGGVAEMLHELGDAGVLGAKDPLKNNFPWMARRVFGAASVGVH
jgi:hypothetical protein